jgi:acyl-CoA dehydrogenase
MNDRDAVLFDAVERLFRETFGRDAVRRGARGEWLEAAWTSLNDMGLPLALVPAKLGGIGAPVAEAVDLLRLVGAWAAPAPLSEAMLGLNLLARAGLPAPGGVVTIAPPKRTTATPQRAKTGWRVNGRATRVPWARHASTVVVIGEAAGAAHVIALPVEQCDVTLGANLAGEPRDDVAFDLPLGDEQVATIADFHTADLHLAGAALRTVMIAGAANRILDLSVEYAKEHRQFGRPIAAFQAVQQNLAVIGGQAAVCRACGDLAAQSLFTPGGELAIAIAKARVGEAASHAAHLAHQVHGAIGFTDEYDLQLYTKRIWAWREEFGNEAEWSSVVGQAAIEELQGPWALITSRVGNQ